MSIVALDLRCSYCGLGKHSGSGAAPWVRFEASQAQWLDPMAPLPAS